MSELETLTLLRSVWRATLPPGVALAGLPADASHRPIGEGVASDAAAPADAGYRIGEIVGRGGMGVVRSARQLALARAVAVKLPAAGCAGHMVREARVTAALDHPRIVPVHDLVRFDGRDALVMRLLEGSTWRDLLRAPGRVPAASGPDFERQLDILLAVADAAAYAHSRGVVHADLKPANVAIGSRGEVQLLDWGLAVDIGEDQGRAPLAVPRAQRSAPAGTPHYMPPELALGQGARIGPWTDTYLLGAILHEVVTGAPPHAGRDAEEVLLSACAGAPPVYGADVPADLQALLRTALARRPERRFADVASLRAALLLHRARARAHAAIATAAGALRQAAAQEQPRARYAALAMAVAGFEQAAALGAAEDEAQAGGRAARAAFAEAALAAGDLGLAETQAHELPAQDLAADALRRAVAAARRAAAASRRRRRVAIAALVAAAVGLAVGLAVAIASVGRERAAMAAAQADASRRGDEARVQRADALRERAALEAAREAEVAARAAAERVGAAAGSITAYATGDIFAALVAGGRFTGSAAFVERVGAHARAALAGSGSPTQRIEAARALARIATRAAARERSRRADEWLAEAALALAQGSAGDAAVADDLARTRLRRARLLVDRREYDRASMALAEAEAAVAELPRAARSPHLADAALLHARLQPPDGDLGAACDAVAIAVAASRALADGGGDPRSRRLLAEALLLRARLVRDGGDLAGALAMLVEATGLLDAGSPDRPDCEGIALLGMIDAMAQNLRKRLGMAPAGFNVLPLSAIGQAVEEAHRADPLHAGLLEAMVELSVSDVWRAGSIHRVTAATCHGAEVACAAAEPAYRGERWFAALYGRAMAVFAEALLQHQHNRRCLTVVRAARAHLQAALAAGPDRQLEDQLERVRAIEGQLGRMGTWGGD